jgi:eukaryotic-like serine/threonine-protein kinase
MSPEQARGRAVDQRADIWAFGCVLYETLTGQPAFAGEDVTTTLARVLEREVKTTALPTTLPPAVRHTIEQCLQKDVKERLADIRDVKLALKGAFEREVQSTADSAATVRPLWRRALPLVASVVAAALGTGFAAWTVMRPGAPDLAPFDVRD